MDCAGTPIGPPGTAAGAWPGGEPGDCGMYTPGITPGPEPKAGMYVLPYRCGCWPIMPALGCSGAGEKACDCCGRPKTGAACGGVACGGVACGGVVCVAVAAVDSVWRLSGAALVSSRDLRPGTLTVHPLLQSVRGGTGVARNETKLVARAVQECRRLLARSERGENHGVAGRPTSNAAAAAWACSKELENLLGVGDAGLSKHMETSSL